MANREVYINAQKDGTPMITQLTKILTDAVEKGASDLFVIAGFPISFKLNGVIVPQSDKKLQPSETQGLIKEMFALVSRDMEHYMCTGDDDFSVSLPAIGRFRVSAYKQRNSCAMVVRIVAFVLPDTSALHIPPAVMDLCRFSKGLVLVTGPANSGKSTTLACMIDSMNHIRNCHIITIEDPIEFLYKNDKCVISQREISQDTESFAAALRYTLRQSPDIILLGEMRDYETISTAITAAETGQLVLSTLHTVGAANTIDRIIDVFPTGLQQQVRVQLAMSLQAVVSQQLVPTIDGALIPAFEILVVNSAVRSMIRECKTHQIKNVIHSCAQQGMITLEASLIALYEQGRITKENAILYSDDTESMRSRL